MIYKLQRDCIHLIKPKKGKYLIILIYFLHLGVTLEIFLNCEKNSTS